MKRLDIKKVNKSSSMIWALIQEALKSKNYALLEKNLERLYLLNEYYCQLLTNQESELRVLQYEERHLNAVIKEYEKKEIEEICKKNGNYQTYKSQIDELFQEK